MLYPLFSDSTHVNISFPEPITFSDQLSHQQAYFFFKKIFSTYTTFEFYSESDLPLFHNEENFIFKARWSFINKKNNNQHVFHIYFYLMNESLGRKIEPSKEIWKITEIRAERL